MNRKLGCRWMLIPCAFAIASCGGGGGSSGSTPPPAATLTSIALAPLAITLGAGSTSQLTVTGTYSDGSTKTLPIAGEAFTSSNVSLVTVSAAGLVTVPANVTSGGTATIGATDTASGLSTSAANSTAVTITVAPTLTSIALSPLTISLQPSGSSQLTVTGTYSDGSTKILAAAGEAFTTSNATIATIDATGIVTVSSNATPGANATIGATDTASAVAASTANSTIVTVGAANAGPPTANSVAAVSATAQSNAQCTAIQPFYWEIGDADSALASGSSTQAGGNPVTAGTKWPIASASKWIYGMYVVQNRGGAANLTPADVKFLNFTSGFTYMDTLTQSATCTAPASGADSINYCLSLPSSTAGELYSSHDPSTDGVFDYDGGHEENHAGQFQPEINSLDTSLLGNAIAAGLNVSGITLRYTQPLLAGGIYGSANDYSPILRAVLSGQLGMLNALGTHSVCAWVGSGCNAAYSPGVTVHWHYSIAHWVEDDPTTGDGAFSSPGAFGFYPWIESNKKFYGVISRYVTANGQIQNGIASSQCGRELRAAWETGVQQ